MNVNWTYVNVALYIIAAVVTFLLGLFWAEMGFWAGVALCLFSLYCSVSEGRDLLNGKGAF